MTATTQTQDTQNPVLPRIYYLPTRSATTTASGVHFAPPLHEPKSNTNPSLEAITYKLQDIRLRLLCNSDLRISKGNLQAMILDLCKSLEQTISHVHSIKGVSQAVGTQKIKAEGPLLSKRQQQVLYFASQGLRNKDIAEKLDLSMPTVTHHLSQAYKVLGVHSRGKAIAFCRESQLI